MKDLGVVAEAFCTCGRCVFEIDTMYCSSCGDVMCKDCYTDCITCGKMYCINCSHNASQCLKCHVTHSLKQDEDKAFLMIGTTKTPIRNSQFMINKTSLLNARNIRLTISGKTFRYCYRSIERQDESKGLDYFLYFEEVNEIHEKILEAYNEFYDDEYWGY